MNASIKKISSALVFLMLAFALKAQNVYTLDSLLALAFRNHPYANNNDLYDQQLLLEDKILDAVFLPEIELNAKASYQSDVPRIDIPVPGIDIPTLPKDQYGISLNLKQILYDGGGTRSAREAKTLGYRVSRIQNKVDRYPVYKSVSTLYFNFLYVKTGIDILEAKIEVLNKKIAAADVAVGNGILPKNQLDELKAGRIGAEQQLIDLYSRKNVILKSLSLLCQVELSDENIQSIPDFRFQLSTFNKQPVFDLIKVRQDALAANKKVLQSTRLPKVFAYSQAGYARPGLNMFSDNFDPYFLVGIQTQWTLYDWKTTQRKQQLLDLQSQILNSTAEQLYRASEIKNQEYLFEMSSLDEKIRKSEELIELRKSIAERAEDSFNNGTMTSADYLEKLTDLSEARLELEKLKLQKSAAAWNYKIENGLLNHNE